MSLRALISRPIPDALATATAATLATVTPIFVPRVAAVAAVAVATPPVLAREVATWQAAFAPLFHAPPPPGLSEPRWRELVADAARLAGEWSEVAHERGWSRLDLFGCSPGFARRLDRDGLAMLLGGRAVVAMTADAATIANPRGAPNVFHRRGAPGAVPIWQAGNMV